MGQLIVNIVFSQEQLAVLNKAIIELPFKEAAPLISHINEEIKRNEDNSAKEG